MAGVGPDTETQGSGPEPRVLVLTTLSSERIQGEFADVEVKDDEGVPHATRASGTA